MRSMRLLLLISALISFSACVSADIEPRAFEHRFYRLDKNVHGLVHFNYCKKYKFLLKHKTKNCKIWGESTLDLNKKEDYFKFANGNFILIQENEVFGK